MYHGAGHDERGGQKSALRRALPHFCAGRLPGRALQKPEHGPEQLRHPRRAGNGAGAGRSGTGGGHRTRCPDESHPAQAQQRRGKSGHRERRSPGTDARFRLFQDEEIAHPGHPFRLQPSCRRCGHHRHRGRGKPCRDQSEGGRHRQHGACQARGCAGPAGGRHRPRRCVRPALRHGRAA